MAYLNSCWSKCRHLVLLMCAVFFVFAFTGCKSGITQKDYIGSWMGIINSGSISTMYQCDIVANEIGGVTLRMSQGYYKVSSDRKVATWESVEPHFFMGAVNEKGLLVTDIGVFKAKVNTFQLEYGALLMTRMDANNSMKLRRIMKADIEEKYPGIQFVD